MPLVFMALLAGGGLGAFFGSQADDVIDEATGQRTSGLLPILLVAVALFFIWQRKR